MFLLLEKVKDIQISDENIKLSGIEPIVKVWSDNEFITDIDRPTVVTIWYGSDDVSRLLNAYKHLFKLLDIKMTTSKF